MTTRPITTRYEDPLKLIWTEAARRLGIEIKRSADTYASYDGKGTLWIATEDALDPDDHLGQMIFHELCHALVQGESALQRSDWGLENMDESTLTEEHACHRLQAYWAGGVGLRDFLAVTTEHRAYYDALPDDPLLSGHDPAIPLAQTGLLNAKRLGWDGVIEEALAATAAIGRVLQPLVSGDSIWGKVRLLHPIGLYPRSDADGRCGSCAWAYRGGPGPRVWRCRQSKDAQGGVGRRIQEEWLACDRHEARLTILSCGECGACCHRGFHLVEVSPREPIVSAHSELLVRDAHGLHLPRPDGRCVALDGDETTAYRCRIYDARPRRCAELEVGGDACLTARRRVGLSR